MEQIQTAIDTKRKANVNPRIDMTPMVDLGFLLITFFIFTTTMGEQNTTNLIMPKDSTDSTEVAGSKALTAILGKDNKLFIYTGSWQDARANNGIAQTNYSVYHGFGSFIRAKQKLLNDQKDKMVLLIKPLETASYQNIVDALDEALINNVKRYSIAEATEQEKQWAANQ